MFFYFVIICVSSVYVHVVTHKLSCANEIKNSGTDSVLPCINVCNYKEDKHVYLCVCNDNEAGKDSEHCFSK